MHFLVIDTLSSFSDRIALLEFHEVINVFLVILKTTISMKFFKGGSNAVLQALKRNFQCYKSRPDHDSHWFQIEPKSFFFGYVYSV